jgi:DNA-binding PadR family transcriptional regulator
MIGKDSIIKEKENSINLLELNSGTIYKILHSLKLSKNDELEKREHEFLE